MHLFHVPFLDLCMLATFTSSPPFIHGFIGVPRHVNASFVIFRLKRLWHHLPTSNPDRRLTQNVIFHVYIFSFVAFLLHDVFIVNGCARDLPNFRRLVSLGCAVRKTKWIRAMAKIARRVVVFG